MMRFRALALACALFAAEGTVSAQAGAIKNLSPAARLRKLSLHLRGLPPTESEYALLKTSILGLTQKQFFEQKTAEYLRSREHQGKMMGRLDQLFRFRPYNRLPEDQIPAQEPIPQPTVSSVPTFLDPAVYNSADWLFMEVAAKNLSWDVLLTSKSYWVLNSASGSFNILSDLGFFGDIQPDLPPTADGAARLGSSIFSSSSQTPGAEPSHPVTFEEDDPRVAGVLTTSRFIGRYATTNLNKNRRRAAAVFRIFLCDEMKPTIAPDSAETEALLDQAFPVPGTAPIPVAPIHASDADEKRHGSDPVCMSCHYKLDPLGSTYMATGTILSPEQSSGALVFTREDGTRVEVPGRGIGDVARFITEQPEYARCQVKTFWNWFIGRDVVLTPQRLEQLTQRFDALGRKTNDFIAHLVEQPEFSGSGGAVGNPKTTAAMKVLRNCNSCHLPSSLAPDFTKNPIGGSQATHVEWIKKRAYASKISLVLASNSRIKTLSVHQSVLLIQFLIATSEEFLTY